MDKVLVLNCGSSSIKYSVFDTKLNLLVNGRIEKIGESNTRLIHYKGKDVLEKEVDLRNHKEGIQFLFELLRDEKWGCLKSIKEICAVGHRIVHGGKISDTCLATKENIRYLKSIESLAPLHNPHNLAGIIETGKIMKAPQVMVFDTAFHQTMPEKAFMYGLPFEFYEKYGIRKYGFHGISHKYVMLKALNYLKKRKANIITCHLGAGSSVTAIKECKSVDTSMGLTPLEGVMMGTRCGDIDPAILQYLVKRFKYEYDELFDIMNNRSGLLGISGVSKDMRILESKAREGDKRCRLAIEMFCYKVAKYIGAYIPALGKVDGIVFTGGIGENSSECRRRICDYLKVFGIKIDGYKNMKKLENKEIIDITSKGSLCKVLVIKTNEELMIAKEVLGLLKKCND